MEARAEANESLRTAAAGGVRPGGARAARIRSALRMRSLRARMLVAFVGLLAVATVGSVVLARQVLESRLADPRAAELQQEVHAPPSRPCRLPDQRQEHSRYLMPPPELGEPTATAVGLAVIELLVAGRAVEV